MRTFAIAAGLTLACSLPSQHVYINGTPSNLVFDLAGVATFVDPQAGDAFFVFLPLSKVSAFCTLISSVSMDSFWGQGNWLRCTLTATDWAYLSSDTCAHLPPAGLAAPLSLLTSDYDFGAYTGVPGAPLPFLADATAFAGNPVTVLRGLDNSWSAEHWQLRTRGFFLNEIWNGCNSTSLTPSFGGFLVARFTFAFN